LPRLTAIHWKKLKKIFEKAGFVEERTTGDHVVMSKDGVLRPIIIPKYPEVGRDIILANMRSAGMDRKEYFKLLASI